MLNCIFCLILFSFLPIFKNRFLTSNFQDWEQNSTPLKASGKEPKFVKPSDKFSSTEGENVFCFLEVQGDPIPTVTWFKVSGYFNKS